MHAQALRPSVTICAGLLVVLAACGPTLSPPLAAQTASPSPTPPPATAAPVTPTATPPLVVPAVMLPSSTATLSPTSLSTLRTVTGRATLESGAPVPGVQVVAQYVEGAARSTEVLAVTDASGSYALRVPTRTDATAFPHMRVILISFVAPPRHVVIGGPPAAIVGANSDSTGVDVLLAPVFLVTGRVLRTGGTAAQSGRVKAVQPDDTTVFGFGHGTDPFAAPQASADATGRYELAVARGVYALSADGDGGRGWWSDEPAIFQRSLLVVDRDRTGIDVVLVPTLSFLAVQVRSGQVPINGVGVTAYRGGDARCCTLVGRATTRASAGGNSGLAALSLPEGTYRIRLEPPATSPLRPQWWNGAPDFAAATDVTVMGSSGARIEVDLGSSP